jgi:chromosome segregation ATPase
MTDEQLIAILGSMQADLKTEISSVKIEMSSVKTELLSIKAEMASKAEMSSMKEDLLEHIHGVGAQLHTQIQELVERLDHMEARQDRQGGILQGGGRAMTRFIDWSESADITFNRYDRRLRELEKRLENIEGGKNGN